MARHTAGPRRSASVDSYLRETRALAAVALLALAAGVVSDLTDERLWSHNALLADLVSSAIVVALSVAVVNELLERRQRRRWSVLAQHVMFELVRGARLIWTGVAELAGLAPEDASVSELLDEGAAAVRDTARMRDAARALIADPARRRRLREEIADTAARNDEVLGRWAPVMLNTDAYAEIIDRHVELASEVGRLGSLLDYSEHRGEQRRWRRSRSSPAVQIGGDVDDDRLAQLVVAIAQLAERLDRGTLQLALRIVPVEWWEARLGTTAPASSAEPTPPDAPPA